MFTEVPTQVFAMNRLFKSVGFLALLAALRLAAALAFLRLPFGVVRLDLAGEALVGVLSRKSVTVFCCLCGMWEVFCSC